MYFTSGSDRAFENLMQGKPGFDHYDSGDAGAPEDCGDCRFYPGFGGGGHQAPGGPPQK